MNSKYFLLAINLLALNSLQAMDSPRVTAGATNNDEIAQAVDELIQLQLGSAQPSQTQSSAAATTDQKTLSETKADNEKTESTEMPSPQSDKADTKASVENASSSIRVNSATKKNKYAEHCASIEQFFKNSNLNFSEIGGLKQTQYRRRVDFAHPTKPNKNKFNGVGSSDNVANTLDEQLLAAAHYGHLDKMLSLLEQNVDVNTSVQGTIAGTKSPFQGVLIALISRTNNWHDVYLRSENTKKAYLFSDLSKYIMEIMIYKYGAKVTQAHVDLAQNESIKEMLTWALQKQSSQKGDTKSDGKSA